MVFCSQKRTFAIRRVNMLTAQLRDCPTSRQGQRRRVGARHDHAFMGLIVLSMGVQFALTGLRKFGT